MPHASTIVGAVRLTLSVKTPQVSVAAWITNVSKVPSHVGAMVSMTVTRNIHVSVFPLRSIAKSMTVSIPTVKKVPEVSVLL